MGNRLAAGQAHGPQPATPITQPPAEAPATPQYRSVSSFQTNDRVACPSHPPLPPLPARPPLQLEKSGAELKIVVATNQLRVDSEIQTFEEGVFSGMMARDFTLAGGWVGGVVGGRVGGCPWRG